MERLSFFSRRNSFISLPFFFFKEKVNTDRQRENYNIYQLAIHLACWLAPLGSSSSSIRLLDLRKRCRPRAAGRKKKKENTVCAPRIIIYCDGALLLSCASFLPTFFFVYSFSFWDVTLFFFWEIRRWWWWDAGFRCAQHRYTYVVYRCSIDL